MSEDADRMKVAAETARRNMASKRPLAEILSRVEQYNGAGLTPAEVLALYEEVRTCRELVKHLTERTEDHGNV